MLLKALTAPMMQFSPKWQITSTAQCRLRYRLQAALALGARQYHGSALEEYQLLTFDRRGSVINGGCYIIIIL